MKISKDIIFLAIGMVSGIFLINIFLLTDAFRGSHIDAANASQYGSFIGGYIGTFLSFVSVLILFLTFKNQRESNEIDMPPVK